MDPDGQSTGTCGPATDTSLSSARDAGHWDAGFGTPLSPEPCEEGHVCRIENSDPGSFHDTQEHTYSSASDHVTIMWKKGNFTFFIVNLRKSKSLLYTDQLSGLGVLGNGALGLYLNTVVAASAL